MSLFSPPVPSRPLCCACVKGPATQRAYRPRSAVSTQSSVLFSFGSACHELSKATRLRSLDRARLASLSCVSFLRPSAPPYSYHAPDRDLFSIQCWRRDGERKEKRRGAVVKPGAASETRPRKSYSASDSGPPLTVYNHTCPLHIITTVSQRSKKKRRKRCEGCGEKPTSFPSTRPCLPLQSPHPCVQAVDQSLPTACVCRRPPIDSQAT